jgi:anti-sigma regulatory factor (Ser/Thr protein kinase)
MPSISLPGKRTRTRVTRVRLALLVGAVVLAQAVIVVEWLRGRPIQYPVVAGAGILMSLLTFVRFGGMARNIAVQHERRRAAIQVVQAGDQERIKLVADLAIEQPSSDLASEVETVLYRIAQEALSNVRMHARADHAWVTIDGTDDGQVRLRVRDNGVGFDPAHASRLLTEGALRPGRHARAGHLRGRSVRRAVGPRTGHHR